MTEIVSLDEARSRIVGSEGAPGVEIRALESERVPLLDSLGRVLATDLAADGPWPTADRSAMDGFALYAGADGAEPGSVLRVVGAALAGHPFDGRVEAGQAVRIMTGAVVPAGADAVVRVEDTSGFEGDEVEVRVAVAAGANIRAEGSEIAPGEVLLERGRRVRAAEVGALAVLGAEQIPVIRRPRVAIVSTGDEVIEIGREPRPFEVRDSNSWALAAKVVECGGEALRLGIARDDAGDLGAILARGLDEADVLLTIGGVSKGTHDLVHDELARLGVRQVFHGVALKPGKPAFFGVVQRAGAKAPRYAFGLPGNPASCFTTFDLLVAPLLARLLGTVDPAPLSAKLTGAPFRRNWRVQAVPARLSVEAGGALVASLQPGRPSGDPFGLVDGDAYGLIPADADPGSIDLVSVAPYSSGFGALGT